MQNVSQDYKVLSYYLFTGTKKHGYSIENLWSQSLDPQHHSAMNLAKSMLWVLRV